MGGWVGGWETYPMRSSMGLGPAALRRGEEQRREEVGGWVGGLTCRQGEWVGGWVGGRRTL